MLVKKIALEDFCLRDLKKFDLDPEVFLNKVNSVLSSSEIHLKDGYAPFCKHIFLENFTEALPSSVELNETVSKFVQTKYERRREGELPVLNRWVYKKDLPGIAKASYLDLILYSRDQVIKEKASFEESVDSSSVAEEEWHLISIKPQNSAQEQPMLPATALRNTLIEEGGSGVALDRKYYEKCVSFWDCHIELR